MGFASCFVWHFFHEIKACGAHALATNANCCPYDETAVTPHASFLVPGVDPQDAFANIQALRSRYNIYDRYGFFDAVNPLTGQVGHRYLVLDQSMIMAALDNALRGNLMQQHFAADPVIAAARPYLSMEPVLYPVARYASTMSKTPMVRNLW